MRREKRKLYEERMWLFMGRIQKGMVFADTAPLKAEYCRTEEPVPFTDRLKGEYKPISKGEQWGTAWDSAWFHLTGTVPVGWKGSSVVLHLDLNGEACVFDDGGCPVYGMTNQSVFAVNYGKDMCWVTDSCSGGDTVDLWVEAAANSLFGLSRPADPPRNCPQRHGTYEGKVVELELCLFDNEMWHLLMDLKVLESMRKCLGEESPRRGRIVRTVNQAIDIFADDRKNAAACRLHIKQLFDTPANASDMKVTAVGHAHIDTGWLWPVRESVRKCARTFSSQINLIEKYPGYVFGASQPQHYAFVKEHYPELYEKIKTCVADGSWEPQGGMWVEADCNIISGESMVRQFVHGKNFFMDEFGFDVKNTWIPDVFGYSAAMPQIMQRAGVEFFLTQKISWSQFNTFPHNTFKWRGIDGSEVITHFPPEDNYNSGVDPEGFVRGQDRFKENSFIDEYISLFGIGNGGGGPKEEHVEKALRLKDFEGCPKVTMGRADDFFNRLKAHEGDLETWFGELYLELHRGTLTTQAKTKRGNRRLEQKLRDVEFICSCLPAKEYPADRLDALWKNLLMNQFHDILPGSSIAMVYKVAEQNYADGIAECEQMLSSAADSLMKKDENAVTLFNSLSCAYTAPIRLPESWNGDGVVDDEGNLLSVQKDEGGTVVLATIPSQSFVTLRRQGKAGGATAKSGMVLENDMIRYEFSEDGTLKSALDKESETEVLGGVGNLFSLYEDRPNNWDAWEIDSFYEEQLLEHAASVKAERLSGGPVRQGIRFTLSIGESSIVQNVYLAAAGKRLDFVTEVDWHERHRMLRVSFPTTILAEQASFDIQYGYVKRNTHNNNSWDMAKFEVAAHKYVDLSDNDYGVALLNNCKYGHKVHDNLLDLNLLRSPTQPDPDADQGLQKFTYSLLPHTGTLVESEVMAEAAMLNQLPVVFDGYAAKDITTPCRLDGNGISMEVLKKAEKSDDIVFRLVETRGRRSCGSLKVYEKGAKLVETDLLEWSDGDAIVCDSDVEVVLKPFEIRTYKLCR